MKYARHDFRDHPETGDTEISIIEYKGNIYAVDQHGKMICGLIEVSASTCVDGNTVITMKVNAAAKE